MWCCAPHGDTLYGHVAGADEIAAHAHARTVCGLGRSPLLLTAALATAAEPRHGSPLGSPHGREK